LRYILIPQNFAAEGIVEVTDIQIGFRHLITFFALQYGLPSGLSLIVLLSK